MQTKIIELLYSTNIGKYILKFLVKKEVSDFIGYLLNKRWSKLIIKPFIKANNIDMNDYIEKNYISYNDFFIRKLKNKKIDMNSENFISPSDGKITLYNIDKDSTFSIKETNYTIHSLLRDGKLGEKYSGGYCIVIRLSVDDYHRYSYVDSGIKTYNRRIDGSYNTVNPFAVDNYPVYKENTREYTMIRTQNFGDIIQMEVGAMMVGKIVNYHNAKRIVRGQEKGYFEFGGSTIVLLVKKDIISIRKDIVDNSLLNIETKVKVGEVIATKL